MNKFISRYNNPAIHYINIEMPIYQDQLNIIHSELTGFISRATNKWDKLMGKYYDSITHDGYGSFVLIFDEDVLNLKPETQDKIITSLNEFFMNSNYNEVIGYLRMIEEGDSPDPQDVSIYINSLLNLGYGIDRQELRDLFSGIHGSSLVDQEYLVAKLKFPDCCSP